jgi:hypothetical protein
MPEKQCSILRGTMILVPCLSLLTFLHETCTRAEKAAKAPYQNAMQWPNSTPPFMPIIRAVIHHVSSLSIVIIITTQPILDIDAAINAKTDATPSRRLVHLVVRQVDVDGGRFVAHHASIFNILKV